jgi:hypothetical protein
MMCSVEKYRCQHGNIIFPNGIMKLQLDGRFIIPYANHKDGPLYLLFLFLKYIFGIRDWGLANSFCHHVIQNSIRQMNFQNIFPTLKSYKIFRGNLYSLYLFSRNSYECLIWIFIFDTDQAQINSVSTL